MVLGTTSDAGKSWVTTAICRYLSNQGLRCAPFKAQNMSNNARVVPSLGGSWGEIGSAQYFQALAARTLPSLDMNPVLLKPQSDCSSQVVVMGKVDQALTETPWKERSKHLWPHIQTALLRLRQEFEVVVIEGAGSPAEINLRSRDIVNMSIAHEAEATSLLVCDIDRGGAFAHLYGTWALLDERDRSRISGFVLNKFRGDPALLAPGPQMLEEKTGVPTVGVIPMVREHRLPEEDGQSMGARDQTHAHKKNIVVVSYPRISNLDEFASFYELDTHQLVWSQEPKTIANADLLILPGSKNTVADLGWLRAQGLDKAIVDYARSGRPVIGICGGLQILGRSLEGREVAENRAHTEGLGLLGVSTVYSGEKTLRPIEPTFPRIVEGPWCALSQLKINGYEIHVGDTAPTSNRPAQTLLPDLAWMNPEGNILGIYAHGVFENPNVLSALFGQQVSQTEQSFEVLAKAIQQTEIPAFLRKKLPGELVKRI